MNTLVIMILLVSSALVVGGSKLEATEGQDFTISFDIAEVERADEVKITFKGDKKEKALIAQSPWTYDDPPPSGVSLMVGNGSVSVTIRRVNSSRSGVYEAQAFFGKHRSEVKATLVVNKAPVSRTPTPSPASTTKPPNSDLLLWLWALVPVVFILGVVSFCIYRMVQAVAKKRVNRFSPSVKMLNNNTNTCSNSQSESDFCA